MLTCQWIILVVYAIAFCVSLVVLGAFMGDEEFSFVPWLIFYGAMLTSYGVLKCAGAFSMVIP